MVCKGSRTLNAIYERVLTINRKITILLGFSWDFLIPICFSSNPSHYRSDMGSSPSKPITTFEVAKPLFSESEIAQLAVFAIPALSSPPSQ